MVVQGRHPLMRQIGDVLVDVPRFLTAPLYRTWHLRWGARADEVRAPMIGDHHLPSAQFRATRAITIAASPLEVWPWLVQVGCGRAGWYSNDLLDNLGRPSSTAILPELQHLEIGQWVPMSPNGPPTERTALRVDAFQVASQLLWTKPDSSWAWQLTPTAGGGTRLVTRIRASYDWTHHPARSLFGMVLMELGDFAMNRRMLLGIKRRAEAPAVHSRTAPVGVLA